MEKILTFSPEPWNTPLSERIKDFHNTGIIGKKRILFLYPSSDASTFRYRGYNLSQYLKQSSQFSLHFFFSQNELDDVQTLVATCDLLVLCRTNWNYKLDFLITKAKAHNIPVVFDVDDLIFDLQYLPLLLNTVGSPTDTLAKQERDLGYWFSNVGRIHLTASRADGFITTNAFLGEKLRQTFDKPYTIIRNSLNQEQIDISVLCIEEKRKQNSNHPFTIGYFSGSPTHMNDFSTVAQEIQMFLLEHPDAKLMIVGIMKLPSYLQPLADAGQIEFHPLVDFLELQKLISSVDVNIVPLIENDFTNCKSELKYFEAAIVDTITVATPTYAYKNAINHGENGFLCSPGQWYDILQDIYYDRIDRAKIIENARIHAMETFYGKAVLEEAEAGYQYFLINQ